jgi:hypothetical protein
MISAERKSAPARKRTGSQFPRLAFFALAALALIAFSPGASLAQPTVRDGDTAIEPLDLAPAEPEPDIDAMADLEVSLSKQLHMLQRQLNLLSRRLDEIEGKAGE